MILVFATDEPLWDAVDTYSEGLVIRANRIVGSNVRARRLNTSPANQDPYWLIQPRWGGTLANGVRQFSTHRFIVDRVKSHDLLILQAPELRRAWSVTVNQTARIILPAYNPEWEAPGL